MPYHPRVPERRHHPNKPPSLAKRFRHTRTVRWLRKCLPRDVLRPRRLWLWWQVLPYTMCSYEKLANVYDLAAAIEERKAEGCFVECGVWKGGCSAVMAWVARCAGSGRGVWLFDSFEGLPEPTAPDGRMAEEFAGGKSAGRLSAIDKLVAPLEHVRALFSRLDLHDNVHIEKGWFQDTVPAAAGRMGPVAILRLDGDWYESTLCCLEALYDNVIAGGYIILDDFDYWQGSKKATEDFFARRKLDLPMTRIDEQAVYFQKVDRG
jgi:hypothetical protein